LRQQPEPLPFGQMAWRDYLKVPVVESSYLMQIESLGKRYHGGIHGLEAERRIRGK